MQKMLIKPLYLFLTTVLFNFYFGCSSSNSGAYDSLINKGPLPLSSTNAYVGSNLFLSQEFQKSNYLYNFFKSRGAPNAIEVKDKSFGKHTMNLYYPKEKELYIAELLNTEVDYQWITRGPYRIERNLYRQLAGLFDQGVSEPIFISKGAPFRFRPTTEELLATQPKPTPKPMPRLNTKPKLSTNNDTTTSSKLNQQIATPVATVFKPLTYDQQALAMAQGFAERANNGDVIHTVKDSSETAEKIAQWYTGDAKNAVTILKNNGLTNDSILTKNLKIQIPLSLVKQFKRME